MGHVDCRGSLLALQGLGKIGYPALKFLVAGFFLLGLVGCPRRIPMPDIGPETGHEVVEALQERNRQLCSVRGFARMEAYGSDGRVRVDHLILAERPNKLRIETLTPFDQPVAYLASDGERFSMYSLNEKRFFQGRATTENLALLVPIRLEPEAFVEVLLGGVPLISTQVVGPLGWDDRKGLYLLWVEDKEEGLHQEISVSPDRLLPQSTRVLDVDGKERYSLEWDDFNAVGEVEAFARRLRFKMPADKLDVSMRWRETELNADLPEGAWTLERPKGVPVEELD